MQAKRLLAALAATLLLAACHVTREHAVARHQQATSCCRSLAELEYAPVADGVPQPALLYENARLFDFDTGRSYFAAFDLGALRAPVVVELRSYVLGPLIQKGHVFYPDLLFLDEHHQPVTVDPGISLQMVRTTFKEAARENRQGLPARLEGAIVVVDPRVRYLVVRTTDAALAENSLYFETGRPGLVGLLAALGGFVPSVVNIKHSPFGRLIVTVRGTKAEA